MLREFVWVERLKYQGCLVQAELKGQGSRILKKHSINEQP